MQAWKTVCALTAVLALSTVTPAVAQPAGATLSPEEAAQRTEAFLKSAADFTRDVRLDEGSLNAILDNIGSLNSLKDDEEGQDLVERAYSNGSYDFGVVTSDPEYVAWCGSHGLKPKSFFQSLLRLQMLMGRQESEAALARARATLPQQRQQIESMRSTLGDEGYKQSLAALEASQAQLETMAKVVSGLPAPTAAEQKLLDANIGRIRQALQGPADEEAFGGPGN